MRKSLTDSYTLANGVKIPCVGFGTWQAPDGEIAASSVKAAIQAGYRHIDTAAAYQNEESVGRGIRESGVNRQQLFVTTKLWNLVRGYKETIDACHQSLKKLGLDYLDLYLIHWPNPARFRDHWQEYNAETWRAFESLYKAGDVRAIGVSNFRQHHLDELSKTAAETPMVNQIRLCPGDIMPDVVEYCRAHGMLLEAYSPLGNGKIFKVPEVARMAEKYGKTVAQICLRWSLQMDFLPLPKSVTPGRIEENAQIFDFSLSEEDVEMLTRLQADVGGASDPDLATF